MKPRFNDLSMQFIENDLGIMFEGSTELEKADLIEEYFVDVAKRYGIKPSDITWKDECGVMFARFCEADNVNMHMYYTHSDDGLYGFYGYILR